MEPRRKERTDDETESPTIQQQDWDAIRSGRILPDGVPQNGDIRYDVEEDGELPEEDDDNAYQESDEALPDDTDERVISRDLAREGGPFDEE
ncbi:hypothetical protein [Mesorhizobium sp. M1378]|uniref:hypothetical protein n=1 Tax=unclassified Mesorhizobium TaxID=325217 RepID=UPI00333C1EE0